MRPQVHHFDSLPSTMDRAHELARAGAEHGTVVVAREQTGGRGARGRAWSSPIGGLWCSAIVRPPDGAAVEVLSIRAGLVVASMLESAFPDLPGIRLKWPNDLLIEGRKVAGVLCEARWSGEECLWAVVGVGINIRNAIPEELAQIAARIADFSSHNTPGDLLHLVTGWIAVVARYPSSLGALELAYWARRDALFDQRIESPLPGIARGITPRGALRVLGDDGVMREATGGVAPIEP